MPEGLLSLEAVRKLTGYVFLEDVFVDEADTLQLLAEDWNQLSQYLQFHGLQLPVGAKAQSAYTLCRDLSLRFGQGIRLAAGGRESEIQDLCPKLNEAERSYCVAVGKQNLARARQMARKVFGPEFGPFLS